MLRRQSQWAARFICVVIGCATLWGLYAMMKPVDEVVLTLGQSYEQVRLQSRSTLPPASKYNSMNLYVERPAILRFDDPQYGFVTPAAKFLSIYAAQRGRVSIVTLSPQIETLPLGQAMAIVLDLQKQWRQQGWHPVRLQNFSPITDAPDMIERIRRGEDPKTFWQAAGKYQAALDIRRFVHEDGPKDERYLITLELSGPPMLEDDVTS